MSGASAEPMTTVHPIILAAADVARLSGRVDAMEVMREAFRALGGGTAVQPPQTLTLLPQDAGDFITYLGVLAEGKVFGAAISCSPFGHWCGTGRQGPHSAHPAPAAVAGH